VIKDKSNKGYHKLLVWQKAKSLVVLVYKKTERFSKSEEFGLKSQARRAILSVALTIVEGYRRRSTKEFLRYLDIAVGSLSEVEACLEIALDLEFLTEEEYKELDEKSAELAFLINSLELSLKRRIQK